MRRNGKTEEDKDRITDEDRPAEEMHRHRDADRDREQQENFQKRKVLTYRSKI